MHSEVFPSCEETGLVESVLKNGWLQMARAISSREEKRLPASSYMSGKVLGQGGDDMWGYGHRATASG